jgi:hypothetical protein
VATADGLGAISYVDGRLTWRTDRRTEPQSALAGYLDEARRLAVAHGDRGGRPDDPAPSAEWESLRWFPLPGDVV